MAPDKLFHYTTADGLIGIIKDWSLWATNAFYLNDSQEVIGGVEIARRILKELRASSQQKDQADRIDWLLNDTRNVGTVRSKPAYVCCLSSERDQLSQWRAYCRGGGFAIEFPTVYLREALAEQGFSLDECIYSETDQGRLIKETIEKVVLPWVRGARLPIGEDPERFEASGKFTWELLRVAARLKNSSFAEEREFRIVSLPEWQYKPEKLHFRQRAGVIIPYTTIKLPSTNEFRSRVQIMIGPTPHPEESKASVYDLVRRFRGHAIGISITRTPFREW